MKFKEVTFQITIITIITSYFGKVFANSLYSLQKDENGDFFYYHYNEPIYASTRFLQHDRPTNLTMNYSKVHSTNTSVITTNRPRKNGTRAGIFPQGVTFLVNPNTKMRNKEMFQKHAKCKILSGLLYLLTKGSVPDPFDPTVYKKGITLKPVYILLTEESFSIQENQLKNSLNSVSLERITRVTQEYLGTTCFDIIVEKKEPIQLCAESKFEMDDWIIGILEFKECLLKGNFELIDANANAFSKTKLVTDKPIERKSTGYNLVERPVKPIEIPDSLYYNNNNPTIASKEIAETDVTLTRILNQRKREELAQRQIKRQIEDKVREVKEAHLKILRQQKLLAKKNSLNKQKELAMQTKKIEDDAVKAEQKILNNALHSMSSMSVNKFY